MLEQDSVGTLNIDGLLTLARTEPVLDRVALPGGDCIDPAVLDPRFYPHWGILRRENENFLLTERAFFKVDGYFLYLPSQLINFLLGRNQIEPVTVLDAGGGRDALTAKGLAKRHPAVRVVNIDLVTVNEEVDNFNSKRGDLCDLELPDNSVDLVYSHQVVPFMDQGMNLAKPVRVVEEIYRVLRPGAVGLIDYTNEESFLPNVLKNKGSIDGSVSSRRKSYGGEFLFIAKSNKKAD